MTGLMPETACPFCGYKLNAATDVKFTGAKPSPGDISVCIECTSFLRFNGDLKLEALPAADMAAMPDEIQEQLWHARRVLHRLDRAALRKKTIDGGKA